MYYFVSKVANRAMKTVDRRKNQDENALIIFNLFKISDYNGKIKKLINKKVTDDAESNKSKITTAYINQSRDSGKWIYLASSHNDCAEDHVDYQGKLYYDNKAPESVIKWSKGKGLRSIQWVMDGPVWFITRPNCRHYFKSLPIDVVKKHSVRELKRRYKTHRKEGDRALATPASIAIEEYEDRLKLLMALYREHPTEFLRRDIQKTKLLLKKWKNIL